MSSIWINLSTPFIILVALIFTLHSQNGVLATEQKPETPLWQISSTQTPVVPTSSSIETSTLLGPTPTSQGIQTPSSSVSSTSVSQPHNTARDEIYIDDEGLEGSGGRGEIHDDLEKEPEYSGSGFGPDDEDSSSSTPHRKKVNGGYKSTNAGNGGYKATNSKNKEPIPDNRNSKQPEKHLHFPTETNEDHLDTGSGDKHIDNDNDDGDDEDDGDDSDEEDVREPIVPTEEEEGGNKPGYGGVIPSGNTNTNIDEDDNEDRDDDLTTVVKSKDIENTDDDISNEKPPIEDIDSDLTEGSEIEPGKTGKSDIATTKPIPGIDTPTGNEVFIMDNRGEDRTASFFAQPGILAAVIGGAVVGLLCAILVVMFIVYRMRKKDEGSYALDEPKRSPAVNSYAKNANNREFYA
ncbi:syndecan-like isoform X2 [Sitodiplosis mosellana]|uniref:syndecan-like isoform X2 n=1 Tax=Sitodiplosis mosellana TaxID=263140 RepID=UPI0024447C31|nr:syndecan-like isoform X2 [Sitodiplosis mosellana]XP_055316367.1 syndecan-like isoform X2 [Sitodiplosis mosellana]XP_055316368.1 syndecan-like isoform X2 [Sitodiplosis mosellana]